MYINILFYTWTYVVHCLILYYMYCILLLSVCIEIGIKCWKVSCDHLLIPIIIIELGTFLSPTRLHLLPVKTDQPAVHLKTLCITKTHLFKYTENSTTKKWKFSDKNSDIFIFCLCWGFTAQSTQYFCSKHWLWVLFRTTSPRQF